MKKLIIALTVVMLIIFIVQGCKKSDDTTAVVPLTTLQKLQAKWQIQSILENDHYSGADHVRNSTGGPGDYLDFRTDGKLYLSVFGFKDTIPYTLSGDTKIILSAGSATTNLDIKTLTSNSLILYNKELYPPSDYYEETVTLTK